MPRLASFELAASACTAAIAAWSVYGPACRDASARSALMAASWLAAGPALAQNSGQDAWWPQFRGPNSLGVSLEEKKLPVHFGPEKNVLWKTPLPVGHSSPCIWEDRIFLTGFNQAERKLETLCLDRRDGQILWRRPIPAERTEKVHEFNSPAVATPATDGERVYVYFGSHGLLCYDFEGNEQWQKSLPLAQTVFGTGTSPVVAGDLVLLNRDFQPDPSLLAVRARTGETVWKQVRTLASLGGPVDAYATPVVWRHDGVDEVVIHGKIRLTAYDLKDGSERWYVGATSSACSTPVLGDGHVFVAAHGFGTVEGEIQEPPPFDALLKKYDRNGDGQISAQEFPTDLYLFQRPDVPGTELPLKFLFGRIDGNKDGQISRQEWETFLERSRAFRRQQLVGLLAIKPGSRGDVTRTNVLWRETHGLPEVPSPLYYRDRVYMVRDGGIASCLEARTGRLLYRERLWPRGPYFSSPVAGDGKVYAASQRGVVVVFAAGDQLKVLARNDLGESIQATPALVDGKLYVRTEKHLYAFGGVASFAETSPARGEDRPTFTVPRTWDQNAIDSLGGRTSFRNTQPYEGRLMRSVVGVSVRSFSAALVLTLLTTPLVIDTRPTARGDDQAPAKALPTELAKAIRDGDLNAVRAQLDGGVDVNARDATGNTPLLLAAVFAGPDCVELLLKKGADVNATNKLGARPLIRAATNYEKAKLLIDAGADVKVKTKSGRTPLTLAARKYGNSKTVKLLLSKGADAKERNARGINPIQVAAAGGDLDTVKLLVEAGADVNDFTAVSGPGASSVRTPLGWAASRNDVPMVRYLLEHKADPNKATPFGTPLTWAARGNSAQAAELLLAHGARTDIKSGDGSTPLHWAALSESPHPDLVKLLLKHSADANAEFGEQIDKFLGVPQTPRLLAEKRGQTALVEALIAVGAKAPPKPRRVERSIKSVPEKPDAQRLHNSAEAAIRLLQESAVVSSESARRHSRLGFACATCHQHFLPLAAMGQAKDRAVRLDRDALTRLGEQVAARIPVPMDIAEVDLFLDPATGIGYASFGLIADHHPASATTDQSVHHLAVIQGGDGRWPSFANRPPMQVSDVSATALAIQAIQHYGWAGRKAEFEAAVDRGRRWLWTVKAETTEDAAYQLLGLHWAGEPADKLTGLAKALLSQQRKDGGWAQLPKLESDAYATGQALYALSRAVKHPTTSRDWQQGLRFLLGTQCDDGSWHVVSRAYPFQPTMNSGFPHGRDSWISAAGTSWAVLAMTEALPLGTTTEKPPAVAKKPKDAPPVGAEKVDFAKQIKPLLERSCVACHGPDKQRSNFRLDSRETLLKGGNTGSAAVVPGKSAQSALLDYVSGRVAGMEMPPMPKRDKFAAFTKDEVELVRGWIEQGAAWPEDVVLNSKRQ